MKTLIIMAKQEGGKTFDRTSADELSRAYSCSMPYDWNSNTLVLRWIAAPADSDILVPFRSWFAKRWPNASLGTCYQFHYGDVEKI